MPFIREETCPDCLVGTIEPYCDGHKCNYCDAYFQAPPSEALRDEYWRDAPTPDAERLAEVAALADEGAVAA